jgi:hypothetical protein
MLEKAATAIKGVLKEIVRAQKERKREKLHLLRGYLGNPDQHVGGNMDDKGYSDISDRKEEQVIGQWKKGHPCYKVAKNLAGLLFIF